MTMLKSMASMLPGKGRLGVLAGAGGPALEQLRLEADRLVERQQTTQQTSEALRTKLEERQAQCVRLEKLLAEVKVENAGLKSSIKDGERQIQHVHEKMIMVQNLHDALKERADALARSTDQAESCRTALIDAFDGRFGECQALETRISDIKQTNLQLRSQIAAEREEVERLQHAQATLREERSTLKAKLHEETAKLQCLTSEKDSLTAQLQQETDNHREQLTALTNQLKAKEHEIEAMTAHQCELKQQHIIACNSLQDKLTGANNTKQKLQQTIDAAHERHAADECALATAQTTINEVRVRLADMQQEALILRSQLDTCIQQHKSETKAQLQEKEALESSLAASAANLARLQTQVQDCEKRLAESAAEAAAAAASAEQRIKQAQETGDSNLDAWKERVAQEMNDIRSKAQAEMVDVRTKMEATEQDCTRKIESLEAEKASYAANKEQLEQKVADAQAAVEAARQTSAEAQNEAAAEAEALADQIASLNADLANSKEAHAKELEQTRTDAADERAQAVLEIRCELERKLAARTEELAAAQNKLEQATALSEELQQSLEATKEKLRSTEGKTARIKAALDEANDGLVQKESLLAQISMAAHGAAAAGPSPPKSIQKQKRAAPTDFENSEAPPQKRNAKPTPPRFRATPQKVQRSSQRPGRHSKAAPSYAETEDTDDSQAASSESDGEADSACKRATQRKQAVGKLSGRQLFDGSQQELRPGGSRLPAASTGRKSIFTTMSAYTASDDDEGQRRGKQQRRAQPADSDVSLRKHKVTKHRSPKDAGKKRKGRGTAKKRPSTSNALNLFGNTDPYAFDVSPV